MFAVLLIASGVFIVPTLASKTTSALPPGNPDADILGRAHLFARFSEPQLALATLRDHGFSQTPGTMRLSAGLLAALGQPARADSLLAVDAAAAANRDERFKNQLVRARLQLDSGDRKSTRLNSSHSELSRMPSSA